MMMRRESRRLAETGAAEPAPAAHIDTTSTPETLLVTSLTDVKAERRVQRRQARGAGCVLADPAAASRGDD